MVSQPSRPDFSAKMPGPTLIVPLFGFPYRGVRSLEEFLTAHLALALSKRIEKIVHHHEVQTEISTQLRSSANLGRERSRVHALRSLGDCRSLETFFYPTLSQGASDYQDRRVAYGYTASLLPGFELFDSLHKHLWVGSRSTFQLTAI